MKKKLYGCMVAFLVWLPSFSQIFYSTGEIAENIEKLSTLGSVLYVAAHPDDENTRLLAYLANERHLRTGYLSLTRGDGGQNLIGKEQGEILGLIRTQELLAARRTDQAEQFFTRANDFGYSKNPEETFRFWDKETVLGDVVWAIRRFKPDVIICRFPTTGEGGHGHHTASAILALEAFEAAADPKKYTEQLKYTQIWQAKRVFWNTFNFGGNNTTSENQLKIDVGGFNKFLGKSYGEIAAESRSMHKSQGFGSARQRGSATEYFRLLRGDSAKIDIFENINTTWNRLKSTEKIQKQIETIKQKFSLQAPENSIQDLIALYQLLQKMDEKEEYQRYWKEIKLKHIRKLILACSGTWIEATASSYTGVEGENISLTLQALNRSNTPISLQKISYPQSDSVFVLPLKTNQLFTFRHQEKLEKITYSNPYWLNETPKEGFYIVNNPLLIGEPENEAALEVSVGMSIQGQSMYFRVPVLFKSTDPVKGEVYRNLEILPPATLNASEKVLIFGDKNTKKIRWTIKANKNKVQGKIIVKNASFWSVGIKNPDFTLKNKGDEVVIEMSVSPAKNGTTLPENLQASLLIEGKNYPYSITRIEYDHIPYQFMLKEAHVLLREIAIRKVGNKIGYIVGAGDEVASSLGQIGYEVTILTDEQLLSGKLSEYNAIVVGVRAYNTTDRLNVHYQRLMQYIKNGGNLIVQYNTNSRVGPLQTQIAPYPFGISRERVTDEQAKVTFLEAQHPALNYPNIITDKDFENWVQERGIYFANELSPEYRMILAMNDAAEKPLNGSLVIATYGKGNFIYTGLSFFRQLPAGVPGAYRLFANLISLPQNK